jgi:hypothetical protein
MMVNETLVEEKMRRFKGECPHFSFNKCPIYTHNSASAKFSTNSHETVTVCRFTRTYCKEDDFFSKNCTRCLLHRTYMHEYEGVGLYCISF